MTSFIKFSVILLLLYACSNATSTPSEPKDTTPITTVDTLQTNEQTHNDSAIIVKKDSILFIELNAAAAQGFSWVIKDSVYKNKLRYTGQTFTNASGNKEGRDGVQKFLFQPTATGDVTLSFIYVQPFNKPFPKDAPSKTFSIKITP